MNVKKIFLAFMSVVFATAAFAELRENPDANTLWIEDGKPQLKIVKPGKGGGWGDGLGGVAKPNGGFIFESLSRKITSTGHYVTLSKDYPYLVYKISMIEPKSGYKHLAFHEFESGQIGQYRTGIFTIKRNNLPEKKSFKFLKFYLYGLKVHFDYIKMVKVPDNYVEVESDAFAKGAFTTGDKIKVTVKLKEEAEDVSVQFVNGYLMERIKLDGTDKLQLKPVNGDTKTWSAEFIVKQEKPLKGTCWFKAVILGGSHPEPLWGSAPVRFKEPAKK